MASSRSLIDRINTLLPNGCIPLVGILLLTGLIWGDVSAGEDIAYTGEPVKIDGRALEPAWSTVPWRAMDQHILGTKPDADDFSGRFKLLWNSEYLLLLAEIRDDILSDRTADPLIKYWNDDCLEIFIDENASGGDHQFSANAFAYHLGLDNQVVDILGHYADGSRRVLLLNEHVENRWRRASYPPYPILWEAAIALYGEDFDDRDKSTAPVRLHAGKQIGFMLAYCDNDGGDREHFYGSVKIQPRNGSKDLGYIDAGVFERLRLRR